MITFVFFIIGMLAGMVLTSILCVAGRDEELEELRLELERAYEKQKRMEEQLLNLRRALFEKSCTTVDVKS